MNDGAASLRRTGRLGVWSLELRGMDPAAMSEAVADLDAQGWGAVWIAGANGPGIWADAERLLAAAPRTSVGTGVVSIWGDDGEHAAAEHARLTRTYGRRLIAGFGVSNKSAAAAAGKDFGPPLQTMERYLDNLDNLDSGEPTIAAGDRILGALGRRMVALAGSRAGGIHPFLVTPESNVANRQALGPDALIAPHQAVVLERDPRRAREIARRGIGMFIGFPAYQANLRRLGFTDDDLVPGGSDRLIDSVVAWGGIDDVARRVRAHWDAGADHVALQVLTSTGNAPVQEWRELSALLDL
jgi:probable F420-dependent oxidoreductase